MTEREHQTGVLARGRGSVMVTGRDWARVAVTAAVTMVLVVTAFASSGDGGAGSWTVAVAIGVCVTVLAAEPMSWHHGRDVVSGDATGLAVAVGLVFLTTAQLFVAAAVASVAAFLVARHRLGLRSTTGIGLLKLSANVVVYVGAVAVAVIVFGLWDPDGASAVVLAASVAAITGDAASAALLGLVMGREREATPREYLLLVAPAFVVVGATSTITVATSLSLGRPAAWLGLATIALWLVSRQQAAMEKEATRLRGLVRVAHDLPSFATRTAALAFLEDRARELTHATSSTIGTLPPVGGALGVLVDVDPETWLHVHDRRGTGESFRQVERETLDGLGDLARLAMRTVSLTEQLRHEATHDSLTGLLTWRGLERRWEELCARAARHGHDVGVLYVDLDQFKQVNDRHGHAVGDRALVASARRLQRAVRGGDVVCRVGGDEFLVVAEHVGGEAGIAELAERLRVALATSDDHWPDPIRASIGRTLHVEGAALRRVVQLADEAMYAAKAASRV